MSNGLPEVSYEAVEPVAEVAVEGLTISAGSANAGSAIPMSRSIMDATDFFETPQWLSSGVLELFILASGDSGSAVPAESKVHSMVARFLSADGNFQSIVARLSSLLFGP
ncbi:hypothetical protein KC349_g122 [Hortaea werneckii]|nr:hypothetical protein KC349_g122 [Hortaea werneckii]